MKEAPRFFLARALATSAAVIGVVIVPLALSSEPNKSVPQVNPPASETGPLPAPTPIVLDCAAAARALGHNVEYHCGPDYAAAVDAPNAPVATPVLTQPDFVS